MPIVRPIHSFQTELGATTFARMLCSPSSRAITRVKAMIPAFAAAYCARPWPPRHVTTEAKLTMLPPPASIMCGTAAFVQ